MYFTTPDKLDDDSREIVKGLCVLCYLKIVFLESSSIDQWSDEGGVNFRGN